MKQKDLTESNQFKEYYEKYLEEKDRAERDIEQRKLQDLYDQIRNAHQQMAQPIFKIKTDEEQLVELEEKVNILKKKIHDKNFKDKFDEIIK